MLTRGTTTKTVIDLSQDDPDGEPNCESAIAVGTDVYVACQLLDSTTFEPRAVGEIYVIDSTTQTIRTKLAMQTKNPIALFEQVGDGTVALSSVFFDDGTGCVEQVTPGTTPTSACIVTNTVLGGYASRMQFSTHTLYMAVSATTFPTPPQTLVAYDLGTNTPTSLSPPAEHVNDVGLCPDGTLVVGDNTKNAAGVRAYSATKELTTAPLPIGLPPVAQHGIECY